MLQRGPAILRKRLQPVIDFLLGNANIGISPSRIAPQLDQRGGIFSANSENAPRTVVFEATGDHMLPRSKQSGGKRISSIPLKIAFVEAEADRLGSVYEATALGTERLPHHGTSSTADLPASPSRMTLAASLPDPIGASPQGVAGRIVVTVGDCSPIR